MKKILMLTTGGTIASQNSSCGLKPELSAEALLGHLHHVRERCGIDTLEICSIDSTNMTCGYWIRLAQTIRESYQDYDGFVISHGTDTLAYTAAALSYMIQDSRKPIVLTGSQKPIGFESTDAKINLQDSILYALDDASQGISVVFDGNVILGTRAKKIMAVSYHAFSSINFPNLAIIRDGKVIRYIRQPLPQGPVKFFLAMNTRIFLLKLTPCTSAEILENIFSLYDCVIIESFGAGGVPDRLLEPLLQCVKKYPEGEKVVIITTQVMHEGSHVSVYEVGKRLEGQLPYLEAKDMNLETVLAKIMWVLGMKRQGEINSWNDIYRLFYAPVAYDLMEVE